MAEVGQRLGAGVCRLTALRNSQSRPVYSGESPASLLGSCTSRDLRTSEDSNLNDGELHPERRATRRKLYKLFRERSQQVNGTFLCTTFLDLDSFRVVGFVQTSDSLLGYHTAMNLKKKMLPARMTSWTRGDVSIDPDAFRPPQQHRAFCIVTFILAEQRSGSALRRLTLDPPHSLTTRRNYSWKRDGEAPLYRSRTAYYDILKVTPSATQSQIKAAYYRQSFIHHPDKNPGNPDTNLRFSEISEAYTVLGNISLKRKYDRGILSLFDIQNAGKPSSKEAPSRSTTSPYQQSSRRVYQSRGNVKFDFDAFYQAHYGQELERERKLRARRQQQEEWRQNAYKRRENIIIEMIVALMLTSAGIIFLNLRKT